MSAPHVKRLGINSRGRDFIVGDIHGAFELVFDAMARADFDEETDRLFCTGDLIDRGKDSHLCVEFLALPFVEAVMGNHEKMLLDLYRNNPAVPDLAMMRFNVERNGLGWWLEVDDAQRQVILDTIRQLPLAIEVETIRGKVGIVHADVPHGMPWPYFLERLEANDSRVMETCLWSRDRARNNDQSGVPGIDRVFVGHTIHDFGPGKYGNVYAIDTGATYGHSGQPLDGHLTMANLLTSTSLVIQPHDNMSLVNLLEEVVEPVLPFGQYQPAC